MFAACIWTTDLRGFAIAEPCEPVITAPSERSSACSRQRSVIAFARKQATSILCVLHSERGHSPIMLSKWLKSSSVISMLLGGEICCVALDITERAPETLSILCRLILHLP